ncbi:N6-adenosine-methyltransferase 70 kDa subunit [Fasciolopsis buskii]|uniref:mRNA m(6)A methyltransferase n=1 Tax=Fasciolopsis buskii TaxID=27845 RepID=A0A8E0VFT5_9TREM|nr:N6-adenosine-methyltransferase 70 kDa subunit [Fasciolopsis buski]
MKHSPLEELKEAKAKQDSMLERLAAKRKQRQNLLAGMTVAGSLKLWPNMPLKKSTKSSSMIPTLPGGIVSSPAVDANRTPDDAAPASKNATQGDAISHSVVRARTVPIQTNEPSDSLAKPATTSRDPSNDLTKLSSSNATIQQTPTDSENTPPSTCEFKVPEPADQIRETKSKCNIPAPHASFDPASLQTELEDLLGAQSSREKESKRVQEEILTLLNTPSSKERFLSEKFRSQGGSQVQQFCAQGTRTECAKYKARTGNQERCTKLHFRKIIHPHTDESLGDCSFLNTCFHVDTCKYVHYTIDYANEESGKTAHTINSGSTQQSTTGPTQGVEGSQAESEAPVTLYPPQWINCDIRMLNMSILGKFAVIMADPPWDIHMELPYGTMSDDEMRRLDIPCLQDDGYIFLWVTGRAMELGRECLRLWGYQRVDEIIWVKTNQLQRLIRTGRTGHWLNHGKEHCLVGVKGKPQSVNRGLDCDVIVSEVRETSHKPDEIYGLIERLSPGTRKLELFGRPHNLQPNWITLGNQLDGTYLVDPAVVERFKKHYPNGLDMRSK